MQALQAAIPDTSVLATVVPGDMATSPSRTKPAGYFPGTTISSNLETRPRSPSALTLPTQPAHSSLRLRWLWPAVAVTAVAALIAAFLLGRLFLPQPESTSNKILTAPTATVTPAPPSPSPLPSPSPTDTPAPAFGIGSTEISEKDGMVMVYIPADEFLMGAAGADTLAGDDEKPQHTVYLDGFWMDRTEATSAMFKRFVDETGYATDAQKSGQGYFWSGSAWVAVKSADWQHPGGPTTSITGQDNYPVVQVSWNDAAAYCRWVGHRLPTEAEWEKAARGSDDRLYPWGDAAPDSTRLNFNRVVGDTTEVSHYPSGASLYGALDMAGNVWEWVANFYSETYYSAAPDRNPGGPASGRGHIRRGGSWASSHETELVYVTTTYRLWNNPSSRTDVTGFRCARGPTAFNPSLPTPAPTPGGLQFTNFRFCDHPCAEAGAQMLSVFPEKTSEIFVSWDYTGMTPGQSYTRVWSFGDQEWIRYNCMWRGPESGTFSVRLWDANGLRSGVWTMTILIDQTVAAQAKVSIEGAFDYFAPAGEQPCPDP